ncbi:MAG: ATP-binding protein [Planctomycetota bacterium]
MSRPASPSRASFIALIILIVVFIGAAVVADIARWGDDRFPLYILTIIIAAIVGALLPRHLWRQDSSGEPHTASSEMKEDASDEDSHYEIIRKHSADMDARKQLRSAHESVATATSDLSKDLSFRLNAAGMFVEVYGDHREDLFNAATSVIGRDIDSVFPTVLAERMRAAMEHIAATGDAATTEYKLRVDGSTRQFEARLAPMPDGDVFVVARDVTLARSALAAARSEARDARDFVRDITNTIPGVVYRYRRTPAGEQSFEFISDGSVALFGFTPEQLVEEFHLVWDLLLPEDAELVSRTTQESAATMQPWAEDMRMKVGDEVRWIRGRSVPHATESDGTVIWDGIMMDVTDEKRWERQLRELELELAHSARLNTAGEMMAVLAHELNQPLGAISYLAQTCENLADGLDDESGELRDSLRRLNEQIERAANIVRRVRGFVGRQATYPTSLSLTELIDQTLELMEPEIRRRDITVQTRQIGEIPPVFSDRIQLQQVLVNLIQNAIEAIGRGQDGDGRTVTVTTTELDGCVDLSVEDTGPGIDPIEFEHIFEPFHSSKDQGMGLGLAVSQRLIHGMGGELRAEAGRTTGAVFHCTIPVAMPAVQAEGV